MCHLLVLLITASLPSVLYLISDYIMETEIQEQVAPVSNNAVTGSVLNNFTCHKWLIYLGMAVLLTLCVLWHIGF